MKLIRNILDKELRKFPNSLFNSISMNYLKLVYNIFFIALIITVFSSSILQKTEEGFTVKNIALYQLLNNIYKFHFFYVINPTFILMQRKIFIHLYCL